MKFISKTSRRTFAGEEEEDNDDIDIVVVKNSIYFYEDISVASIRTLCKHVSELESNLLKLQTDYRLMNPPSIYLHIQSSGGDAYAGLSGMNTLQNCRVPVITIVDGFVASAATFLLLGGSERWMQKHSNLLIHQIRTGFWGRFDELKDEMSNSEHLMKMIKTIYKKNSTMPKKTLNGIIKKEIYLNSDECLNYGLIHKII